MGFLTDRYKFSINQNNWYVKTRYHLKGLRYTITINDEFVHDEKRVMTAEDMLASQTIDISYAGELYKITIAPINAFSYGLHLHYNNAVIYKHKNREFNELKRLKRFMKVTETTGIRDERPFWKQITESLIIGASIGIGFSICENALQAAGLLAKDANYIGVAIVLGGMAAVLWPKKLRFIR